MSLTPLRSFQSRGLLTGALAGQRSLAMDLDDLFSGKPGDPLTELGKQDLDPLSVDELEARIEALRERNRARREPS